MEVKEEIGMLMRYTIWANNILYGALHVMPEEVLRAPRPGRAGGILGVMGHIFIVASIWKAHLTGVAHGYESRHLQVALPLDELQRRQALLDQWYREFELQQEVSAFGKSIDFMFIGGEKGRMHMGQMLIHVANHATYHRGYVADMIYEAGGMPPTMDIPVFIRHEQAFCG